MINWNEVKVGETEITPPENKIWLVVCRHEEKVWLYRDGLHQTRHESSLDKWTIYDPWEEITEECFWYTVEGSDFDWEIWYQGKRIPH